MEYRTDGQLHASLGFRHDLPVNPPSPFCFEFGSLISDPPSPVSASTSASLSSTSPGRGSLLRDGRTLSASSKTLGELASPVLLPDLCSFLRAEIESLSFFLQRIRSSRMGSWTRSSRKPHCCNSLVLALDGESQRLVFPLELDASKTHKLTPLFFSHRSPPSTLSSIESTPFWILRMDSSESPTSTLRRTKELPNRE